MCWYGAINGVVTRFCEDNFFMRGDGRQTDRQTLSILNDE